VVGRARHGRSGAPGVASVVGTKNPRRGGAERWRKSANEDGESRSASAPRRLTGNRTSREGSFRTNARQRAASAFARRTGCPGGRPDRGRPRSSHSPRQAGGGTGTEGAPEPTGCYAVGRTPLRRTVTLGGKDTRRRRRVADRWRRSSLWRGGKETSRVFATCRSFGAGADARAGS